MRILTAHLGNKKEHPMTRGNRYIVPSSLSPLFSFAVGMLWLAPVFSGHPPHKPGVGMDALHPVANRKGVDRVARYFSDQCE